MFFLCALLSVAGYSLDSAFMAVQYRKCPAWAAAFRGLSLGLSMLPLLYFVPAEVWLKVVPHLPKILIACIAAAAGNLFQGYAYRHLPIGIQSAFVKVAVVFLSCILAGFYLEDRVSALEWFWIAVILGGACLLSVFRSSTADNHFDRPWLGIGYALASGSALAVAFFLMVSVSRSTHPFLAGYLWEFGIGLVSTVYALWFWKSRPDSIAPTVKDFRSILWRAAPTAVGTGLFAYASTLGSLQVLSALSATGVIVTTLLGFLVHHERLSAREWLAIMVVVIAIVGFRLSGV